MEFFFNFNILYFKFLQSLEFDFWARHHKMIFFSVHIIFQGNLFSTYAVKVFLVGKTIMGRRDWTIWKKSQKRLSESNPWIVGLNLYGNLAISGFDCKIIFHKKLFLRYLTSNPWESIDVSRRTNSQIPNGDLDRKDFGKWTDLAMCLRDVIWLTEAQAYFVEVGFQVTLEYN